MPAKTRFAPAMPHHYAQRHQAVSMGSVTQSGCTPARHLKPRCVDASLSTGLALLGCVCLAACSAVVGGGSPSSPSGSGGAGANTSATGGASGTPAGSGGSQPPGGAGQMGTAGTGLVGAPIGGAGGTQAAGGNGGVSPTAPVVGPTSGRRLTRAEYANTLTDLFGATVATQAAALPDDNAAAGAFRNDFSTRTPSEPHISAYADVAAAVAATVPWTSLTPFASCTDVSATCQSSFIANLGRILYRRPLVPAEITNLGRVYEVSRADATPFVTGSRLVLEAMLQSPHFLYQLETKAALVAGRPADPGPYEMATRLSLLLWKAAPDAKLIDAAAAGGVSAPDALAARVTAMLSDPRARRGLREFVDDWLRLYANLDRNPVPAVGLSTTLLADMRQETLRFMERLAFDDKADLMKMFLSPKSELSPELARLYGVTPTATGVATYDLSTNPNRVGLLTQAGVLGVRAGPGAASIVKRALTVMNDIVCQTLPPPPDNAAIMLQNVPETLPERERFAMHGQFGTTCAACHARMDPFGWPFVTYDLAGRFSTTDAHGNVLRTDGQLDIDGKPQPYKNAAEFSAIIAASPQVERCLIKKFLGYSLGRVPTASDLAIVDLATTQFRDQGRGYSQLVGVVTSKPMFRAPAPEMFP